ncbi:MAG: hypothetical protein ACYDEN_00460 [Acidimicrobiales bacterium]
MSSMPSVGGIRVLRSGDARAVVDPARGGEIVSARLGDDEILAAMPWPRAAPPDRLVLDEDEFTAAWGGGWQLALPNAGNPCTFGGREYGFHGVASFRPWSVVEESPSSVRLEWRGEGLRASRRVTALRDGLHVSTDVTADGSESGAFIAVEHLILGQAVTDGGYRLELPDAELVDLYASERPHRRWPGSVDPDSGTGWNEMPAEAKVSRFGAVGPVRLGAVRVHPGATDSALDIRWNCEALPFVWIWQERSGDPRPPWNGCTHALGIEPSTVPTDDGIAAAEGTGHLRVVQPGETFSWWMSLRLASPAAGSGSASTACS